MAKRDLNECLNEIEMSYSQLVGIADEIINPITSPINTIINEIKQNVNNLSDDEIRNYMIRLSLESFSFSEIKEKSALKAECAEAVRKQQYAVKFNEASGAQGVKDTYATMECSTEIVSEALFELISNLFKTKLDEIHRVVDVLKSISVSRMAEAKLTHNNIDM